MPSIRIIATPPGEAPEWVRAKWVGLKLPLAIGKSAATVRSVGVLSAPKSFLAYLTAVFRGETHITKGYIVHTDAAIHVLEATSPDAAKWWRENTPRLLGPKGLFVFNEEACELVNE
jgi:hypothetical protein